MKVIAEKWSFGDHGKIREIDIPADEVTGSTEGDLELAFKYGQNDFQPRKSASLSVGDIVNMPVGNTLEQWLVLGMGWYKFEDHLGYLNYIQKCLSGERGSDRDAVREIEREQDEKHSEATV
jgi:hypothetical protein